ncbi:hypothetical protein MJL79_30690, partial [Salmonella enterica subsp. enterica serovar Montevideo]|nr:hypothetical protein [Salmonella enterica subsp. enterica serovar Montevideo]
TITHDLNIDGATASIVLTIFLIGYAFSNIFGGVFTQRYDPKKPFTCIGQMSADIEGLNFVRDGMPVTFDWKGYDHFATP